MFFPDAPFWLVLRVSMLPALVTLMACTIGPDASPTIWLIVIVAASSALWLWHKSLRQLFALLDGRKVDA